MSAALGDPSARDLRARRLHAEGLPLTPLAPADGSGRKG